MASSKSTKPTKNDVAWQKLFTDYDILNRVNNNGFFNISADQIHAVREPRLATKFDHKNNLPELFRANDLAILPITRGEYQIAHFEAYHDFEPDDTVPIKHFSLPAYIQSLNTKNISSETIALNAAYASGIIADFAGEDNLLATVSGRMGTNSFLFNINDSKGGAKHDISVSGSEIEIDAAYEGLINLLLFEAKMDISNDFMVRQLYYPYRLWKNRIGKSVKPIFMIYSNSIYHLYEYVFIDENDYSSIELVKQQKYSIVNTSISSANIQQVLGNVKLVDDPNVPFPQADNFERVVNLCEYALEFEPGEIGASETRLDKNYITEFLDYDPRQSDYYTDAAIYLGLMERVKDSTHSTFYRLTRLGRKIFGLPYKDRQLEICKCILSHRVFNKSLKQYFQSGVRPETNEIVEFMKEVGIYKVDSDVTLRRRASTIKGWLNWIVMLINE